MSSTKRFIFIAIIVVIIGLIWLGNRPKPISVTTATIDTGLVEQIVANTKAGTVKACKRSKLSMPLGGRVEQLFVKEGDHVEAGQILLQLWNDDRTAQLDSSQAQLQVSELRVKQACTQSQFDARDAKRLEDLVKRHLTSEERVDTANTRAEVSAFSCETAKAENAVAKANIKMIKALLEQTYLKAPFAGVVAEINGEIGEYVTPSPPGVPTPPAVDLIDDQCLYISAPIDEVDASELVMGLPARITLDAFRGESYEGILTRIAPYVVDKEKQARTVDVEVKFNHLPENKLLIGYSANIDIIVKSKDKVIRLPTEALLDGNSVLRVNADKTLTQTTVETGISNWTYTEIIKGLQKDQQVVTSLDREGVVDGALITEDKNQQE